MDEANNHNGRPIYGLGFRAGNSIKFYAHSLYWLVRHIGPIDIMTEFLGDGEPVIYGELTREQLNHLVAEGRLRHLRRHPWGLSWPYDGQNEGADDNFSDFELWRGRMLTDVHGSCYVESASVELLLH